MLLKLDPASTGALRNTPIPPWRETEGASQEKNFLNHSANAHTPAGPMGLFARTLPSTAAFPRFTASRLLHHPFRGLHSVHFRYGLQTRQVASATLYTRGFSSFVASTTALIATGWSEPVPGWDFPPTEDQRLFTAHAKVRLGRSLPTGSPRPVVFRSRMPSTR